MLKSKTFKTILALLMIISAFDGAMARTKESANDSKGKDKAGDQILKTYNLVFDVQKNSVSNIQFYTTNYGIFGLDIAHNVGGGYWPRGSNNQYIFGGGIWFGAVKRRVSDNTMQKLVEVTYNPNSGKSWMVPGRIEDGVAVDNSDTKKYRTFFSTDFKTNDGKPLNKDDGTSWPIWDDDPNSELKTNRYFGHYIYNPVDRTLANYPKGPAIISGEDIFCVYKDTDLSRYEGGAQFRRNKGYPMQLQFEQNIYSWGFGDYKDFVFLKYDITNESKDTLFDCWMAPVMDVDIALAPNTQDGASNDRVRFYDEADSLNLAFQWTNGDRGEKDRGFGYLGFDFLESPAVDADGFVRKDKRVFPNKEQLGLKTFKNWPITEDILDDEPRYNAMSAGTKDGDNGAGDKRFMMATGKFTMLPKDTVRVVVGIVLASPSIKKDADGSTPDLQELVRKDIFMQSVYDNSFRAPKPPEKTIITSWKGLNNAVMIQWDSTAEYSDDKLEDGLDFMGYKIFRARTPNLDTFDIDVVSPSLEFSKGKGPFGWKEVASYSVPTPFNKTTYHAKADANNPTAPFIDSLRIVGPYIDFANGGVADTFKIKVMKVGRGIILFGNDTIMDKAKVVNYTRKGFYPVIVGVDTNLLTKPWGDLYNKTLLKDYPNQPFYPILNPLLWHDPYTAKPMHNDLLDSMLIGTIKINPALVSYNPLLWKKEHYLIDTAAIKNLPKGNSSADMVVKDTATKIVWFKQTITDYAADKSKKLIDRMVPIDIYTAMNDSAFVRQALDSVYSFLQRGIATLQMPKPLEGTEEARKTITDYMYQITNHRTFVDIGDDNQSHYIDANADPSKTEKLINNVEYYYKIQAWDEGDYTQPTPRKGNDASEGLTNLVKTYPRAEAVSRPVSFEIVSEDTAKLGGFYNFNLFSIDDQRANQLFAGHELELEFQPYWRLYELTDFRPIPPASIGKAGLYYRRMILRDLTTNQELYNNASNFEVAPCNGSFLGAFTEDAKSYYLTDKPILDSVTWKLDSFGVKTNNDKRYRSGSFTTGNFGEEGYCYSYGQNENMLGSLGFSFDYTLEQRGGAYRADPASAPGIKLNNSEAVTPVNINNGDPLGTALRTQKVADLTYFLGFVGSGTSLGWNIGKATADVYGSFNNGPGDYLVTFKEGGVETMDLKYSKGNKTGTFQVPYLTVEVRNIYSFNRKDDRGNDVPVSYSPLLEHINLDTLTGIPKPSPESLGMLSDSIIGKYNLSSYAWVNSRGQNGPTKIPLQEAWPNSGPLKDIKGAYVGTQGRYYLSTIANGDTLDFVNEIQIAGAKFYFDYPNKGKRTLSAESEGWDVQDAKTYNYGGPDFKAGDQVVLKTTGGVFGLPLPGAKVRFKVVSGTVTPDQLADNLMDQIKVVPNPYYLSHQGQKSPYDSKIYLTRLPKQCKIDIYTIAGDLVQSIDHNETSPDPAKEGIEVWNLLSKNGQRVQSQTLVAVITSSNGAKTIKEFTVVVGGFRIIEDN